jgi:hypothetical protein
MFYKRIEKWVIDEGENNKGESTIKVVIIDTSSESWRKIKDQINYICY